jgi:hypothetical protein
MKVTAKVSECSLGDIKVDTAFGNLDLKLLANLLNKGISMGLPYFNEFL